MSHSRGGYREGAGRKQAWKHGETQTIRVPKALAAQILDIARKLDEGELLDFVTKSKVSEIPQDDSVSESKVDSKKLSSVSLTCPKCGFDSWRVEGYRTTKSGHKKQKRQCRSCGRIWSVSIES